jgi:hypothetical protein
VLQQPDWSRPGLPLRRIVEWIQSIGRRGSVKILVNVRLTVAVAAFAYLSDEASFFDFESSFLSNRADTLFLESRRLALIECWLRDFPSHGCFGLSCVVTDAGAPRTVTFGCILPPLCTAMMSRNGSRTASPSLRSAHFRNDERFFAPRHPRASLSAAKGTTRGSMP